MPTIKAIIYDVDGLLLDTEQHYTSAMEQIAHRPIPDSLRAQMFGRKSTESARLFVEGMDLPLSPDEYLQKRQPLLNKLFPTSKLLPGAEKIITHFHRHNLPQAAATGSTRTDFHLKTTNHRPLFKLLRCTTTGDQVHQGKPDPAIFLVAAGCLNIDPANCLVFEDAPNGVAAARAAGMSVVAVPNPLLDPSAVARADQVLTSLEDFDPTTFNLPAF